MKSALRAALKRARKSYDSSYVPPPGQRNGNKVMMDCCQDLLQKLRQITNDNSVDADEAVTTFTRRG